MKNANFIAILIVSLFTITALATGDVQPSEPSVAPPEPPAPSVSCELQYGQKEFNKGAALSKSVVPIGPKASSSTINGFKIKTLFAKNASRGQVAEYKIFAAITKGSIKSELEVPVVPRAEPQLYSLTLWSKSERVVLDCISVANDQAP